MSLELVTVVVALSIAVSLCTAVHSSTTDRNRLIRKGETLFDSSQSNSSQEAHQRDKVSVPGLPSPGASVDSASDADRPGETLRALDVQSAGAGVKRSRRSSDPALPHSHADGGPYIHWTIFSNWRVLVGLSVFEVIVYVVTVSVVMVLHSRQRHQVGVVREGALTSKYQFTLW